MSHNLKYQPSRLLVTGGAGFIGANFVHYWLKVCLVIIAKVSLVRYWKLQVWANRLLLQMRLVVERL